MPDMCATCKATVRWVVTYRGRWMMLDPAPRADGNVWLDEQGIAHFATKTNAGPPGPRYVAHFATCPDADQHRRLR